MYAHNFPHLCPFSFMHSQPIWHENRIVYWKSQQKVCLLFNSYTKWQTIYSEYFQREDMYNEVTPRIFEVTNIKKKNK